MTNSTTITRNTTDLPLLELEGSLDALAVEIMRPKFDALIEADSDVVIDMAKTDFIDSSGIGAVVFLFKRLRTAGKTLSLVGVHGQPLELLQHLRIDQSIQINA